MYETDYRKIPREYIHPRIPKGRVWLSGKRLRHYPNNMNN